MANREENVRHFLNLIKRSQRGVFKIYIGMIAGVGKTYKMLQEAHEMLDNGIGRTGVPVRKHSCKDCRSFLAKRYSTRARNWKKWIWMPFFSYIPSW